ncbi:MAG: hypothetical protein EXS31_15195 [Pedosphaera sp.]|nr:hypothetical protein [Pedosphaera sp.]
MSKTTVDIREAEAHFAALTPLIRKGMVITLCDAGGPLAEIRPLQRRTPTRRAFGMARGTFLPPDDPGTSDLEIERMFYGEPA